MPEPSESPTGGIEQTERAQFDCWDARAENEICRVVHDLTGNETLASWSNTLVVKPFAILLILVLAFLLRWLLHRAINSFTTRAGSARAPGVLQRSRAGSRLAGMADNGPLGAERRSQRLSTMGSLLKSIATGVIFTIAMFMIIAELGYNIAPLIASAGIIGVALGFGSQALVKDFLSGLFMIVEDQYGVGDVVDVGEAAGTVEAVGLRVTRLRSVDGTVWYVRNGEILRVGNSSHGWSRAVLDVEVAYGSDIARVTDVLERTAREVTEEEDWAADVLEAPTVWGVERLSVDGVVIRLVVKTRPMKQWAIARELRQRITARFNAEGIEIPFPQRALWIRGEQDGRLAPDPATPASDDPAAPAAPRTPEETS